MTNQPQRDKVVSVSAHRYIITRDDATVAAVMEFAVLSTIDWTQCDSVWL